MRHGPGLEHVADRCRLGTRAETLRRLLPGIDDEVPLIAKIGSSEDDDLGWGFPVISNPRVDLELDKLIVGEIDRHLADPSYREDLQSPETEARLTAEPYVAMLTDLLVKATSAGSLFRFDNVIWILLSERIATRLNSHPALNQQLARDPLRYGRIKRLVLASLAARHRVASAALLGLAGGRASRAEWSRRATTTPLYRLMIDNTLVFTERPYALAQRDAIGQAFLVRELPLERDHFLDLVTLVEGRIQEVVDTPGGMPASGAGRYLAALVEQLGPPRFERDRGAFQAALVDGIARYVLLHTDARAVPRRLRRDFKEPARLAEVVAGYLTIAHELVVWDFLDTLRGLLREIEMTEDGPRLGSSPLSPRTVPLTLDRPDLYDHKRWGTYVLIDIISFSRRAREVTSDVAGLAIQNLFAIRRDRLSEFDGRPEFFEGDAVFESFDRALDAVRYVAVFLDHYERQRLIERHRFAAPMESPFRDGVRVGIGTGESVLISVYEGTDESGRPREVFKRIGQVINLTSRLTSGKAGEGFLMRPNPDDEPDPLKLFRATVTEDGALQNNGIVCLEPTVRELERQVQAAELKHVLASEDGGSPLKSSPFELIYVDPVVDRVVLVRPIANRPVFKGFEDLRVRCFEILLLSEDAFREVRRRDRALARAGVPGPSSGAG